MPACRVVQHRSAHVGVEALSLCTDHHFPRHAHDGYGIGLIARGAQRSWSGIGAVEAGAGDVITCNPGEMHDGAPIGAAPRAWRMLYLDPGLVAREAADALGTDGAPEIARPALRDPVLADRFAALFACLTAPAPDALAVEEALLRALAHLLRRHGARPPRGPASPPPAIEAVRRRLDAAPEQAASLAELAALAGCSRFQLLRGFARATGATPQAYRLQARVRLARRLLGAGATPAEAAGAAGFADQSHLTRAFRRQLGITPARYRHAARG